MKLVVRLVSLHSKDKKYNWARAFTVCTINQKSLKVFHLYNSSPFFPNLILWLEKYIFFLYGKFMNLFVHNCRLGYEHFDAHLRWIKSVCFPSKNGKDASSKEKMDRKDVCFFSIGIFFSIFNRESIFPHLYFDLACKHKRSLPRKRCK